MPRIPVFLTFIVSSSQRVSQTKLANIIQEAGEKSSYCNGQKKQKLDI